MVLDGGMLNEVRCLVLEIPTQAGENLLELIDEREAFHGAQREVFTRTKTQRYVFSHFDVLYIFFG